MSEFESAVAEAGNNLAEALRTLAGTVASVAAGMHTSTPGDQRNMAMVIFEDAKERFADVHRKLDPKEMKKLEAFIDGICKPKR